MHSPEQLETNESEASAARRNTLAYHGGNLDMAAQLFPFVKKPWIDLSTGINSSSYPLGEIRAESWSRLPLAQDIARLERAAANAFKTHAAVVAAPGTQALIQLLPRLISAKTIGILGFTYGEYARVWGEAGVTATQASTLDQLADFDLAIVVNPNNPDGRLIEPEDLQTLAETMKRKAGYLLVDEAFMDFTPQKSFADVLPENAIILRSFGKSYGLAGVRLGFVLANSALAKKFRTSLGPWAVSGPAIEIATRAYADPRWLIEEAHRLSAARLRLEHALVNANFSVLGGTHLFVLAAHQAAHRWFDRLAAQGILTRPFSSHPGWLRFGIPGATDWPRVYSALQEQPKS